MLTVNQSAESFGPDPVLVGFWVALVGVPLPLGILDLVRWGARPDVIQMLGISVLLPTMVLIFALRFRAVFSETAFAYRRWGKTFVVRYAEIDHIEITNRTRISGDAVGAFVVTKNGARFAFWPKLFPRKAIQRFMALGEVRG